MKQMRIVRLFAQVSFQQQTCTLDRTLGLHGSLPKKWFANCEYGSFIQNYPNMYVHISYFHFIFVLKQYGYMGRGLGQKC